MGNIRNRIGLLVLGALNNLFYVLVNSAGQRLCAQFHKEDWIAAILWCNIAFGLVARLIHMFFLEKVSFSARMLATGIGTITGLLTIIGSIFLGKNFFWLCLLGIVFVGSFCSFGESVVLCYLKKFPSDLVGAWSSGTGFAGVGGTLIYAFFILPGINLTNQIIFAIVTPLVLVYLTMFFFVVKPPAAVTLIAKDDSALPVTDSLPGAATSPSSETSPLLTTVVPATDQSIQQAKKETGVQRFWRTFKYVWFLALNLILVYFFEYVACTGGSDRAQGGDWKHDSNWFIRNAYVVLNFCYQLGVVISRSSLAIVKIKRIEVLSILQLINMVLWILQGVFHTVHGWPMIWILFVHMVFIGLLGGASYVNVFYLALHKPEIPSTERELGVNIVALSNTIGITMSSIAILILDMTLWKLPAAVSTSLSSSSF